MSMNEERTDQYCRVGPGCGLDAAGLGRALEGCALPSPAAPVVSAEVIDGAVNRARVRGTVGKLPDGGRLSDETVDELLAGAPTEEEIFGPGGVFAALTKRLVERAMEVELIDHVGYEPHCEPPGGAQNQRNGTTPKTDWAGRQRTGKRRH